MNGGADNTSVYTMQWLTWAFDAGYGLLLAAFAIALWRAARGPEMVDRLAALKLAWLASIGIIAVVALQSRAWALLDLVLALAILSAIFPLAATWARRRAESSLPPGETEEAQSVDSH